MKKYLFFLLLVIGGLSFNKVSFASTLYSQTIINSTSTISVEQTGFLGGVSSTYNNAEYERFAVVDLSGYLFLYNNTAGTWNSVNVGGPEYFNQWVEFSSSTAFQWGNGTLQGDIGGATGNRILYGYDDGVNFYPAMELADGGGFDATSTPPIITTSTFNPTIHFVYPFASSTASTTYNLFSPWLLYADGADLNSIRAFDGWQVRLQWYITDLDGNKITNIGNNRNGDFTGFAYGTAVQMERNGIQIPRQDIGIDLASTTIWHASAQLYDSQDPNNPNADLVNPIQIATTSVVFSVIPVGLSPDFTVPSFPLNESGTIVTSTPPNFTTSTVAAYELLPAIGFPSACSATSTYSFWAIGDWKCLFLTTMFSVQESTKNYATGLMNSTYGVMSNVFPLSIIAGINNDINLAIDQEQSATSSVDVVIGNGSSTVFMGRQYTFYNASTTSWIKDKLGFDYRAFMSKLIWAFTGIVIVLITYIIIKKLGENNEI